MVTQALLNYIQEAKSKSISDEEIKVQLLHAGWGMSDVANAFITLSKNLPLPPPPTLTISKEDSSQISTKETRGNMGDVFQHILMFISLYIFATSTALILYHFVDTYLPQAITNSYEKKYTLALGKTLMNSYLSALIVSYPVWAFFFLKVTKHTKEVPGIHLLNSRRKLIYLTLICTFIILLVSVISIINRYLNGNASMNLFLHFLVTTGISMIIFVYYIFQVKDDQRYV